MNHPFLAMALVLVGCAPGATQDSPRAVAETVVRAWNEGKTDLLVGVLPPTEALRKHFVCKPSERLVDQRARMRDEADTEFAAFREAGMRVRLVSFEGTPRVFLRGDSYGECEVTAPVTILKARVTLTYRKGARNDEETETWPLFRFDEGGPWYYAKL